MEVRIDKWLWCVRIYKTRNQATEDCRAGKIKINGTAVKASHNVKIDEVVEVVIDLLKRKIRVKGFLDKRVSAKLVVDYAEDLTSTEEIEKLKIIRKTNFEKRDRGIGRPTKRERREIEKFKYL